MENKIHFLRIPVFALLLSKLIEQLSLHPNFLVRLRQTHERRKAKIVSKRSQAINTERKSLEAQHSELGTETEAACGCLASVA
jgi:hypothetical protein